MTVRFKPALVPFSLEGHWERGIFLLSIAVILTYNAEISNKNPSSAQKGIKRTPADEADVPFHVYLLIDIAEENSNIVALSVYNAVDQDAIILNAVKSHVCFEDYEVVASETALIIQG